MATALRTGSACIALALAACNQVLGIASTQLIDAVPPDAAPRCPQYGETPDFSGTLRALIAQPCWDYTFSSVAGLATATCESVIMEGPIEQPLLPATGLMLPVNGDQLGQPRLTPDGNRMIVRHTISDPGSETLEIYDRGANGWQFQGPLVALGAPSWVSNIVASAMGYRVLTLNAGALEEWEYAGTWQLVRTTPVADLGLATPLGPTFAPGGLSVVIQDRDPADSSYHPYYADRPSQDEPFGPVRSLPGLTTPYDYTIAISDGCTGAYESGLDTVFFVRRQ